MSSRREELPTPHLLLTTELFCMIASEWEYQRQICNWMWQAYCDLADRRPFTAACFRFTARDEQAKCLYISLRRLEYLKKEVDEEGLCEVMYVREISGVKSGNLALPKAPMDPDHTTASSEPTGNTQAPQDHVLQPPHLFVHPNICYNICGTYRNLGLLADWMVRVTKAFAAIAEFTPEEFDFDDGDEARHRLTFDIHRLQYADACTGELTYLDVLFMEDLSLPVQRLPLHKTPIVSRLGISPDQADGPRES